MSASKSSATSKEDNSEMYQCEFELDEAAGTFN